MIRVFYGENRVAAQEEIRKIYGDNYEVVEGENLTGRDLPSLFDGASLFAEERKIVIRDALLNKEIRDELPKYVNSTNDVVIWEMQVDKRSSAYKTLKEKVEIREFGLPKNSNFGVVFDIYKVAKKDGKKAVGMLETIKEEQEPMMFLGLMVSQALKDYKAQPNQKTKRVLKELSKLDMEMKSESRLQPWPLVQSFLLRLSSWL